jgi:hypothetical protein
VYEDKANRLQEALQVANECSRDLHRQLDTYRLYSNVSIAGLKTVYREQQRTITTDQQLAYEELPRAKRQLKEAETKIRRQNAELARLRKDQADLPSLS